MGVEEVVGLRELSEILDDALEAPASEESRVAKDEYLTIKEAASYLSISEPVLRLTIRRGGRVWRTKNTNIARNTQPLAPTAPQAIAA